MTTTSRLRGVGEITKDHQIPPDEYPEALSSDSYLLYPGIHAPSSLGSWTYLSSAVNSPASSLEHEHTSQSHRHNLHIVNTYQGLLEAERPGFFGAGSPLSNISLDGVVVRSELPSAGDLTPGSQSGPLSGAHKLPSPDPRATLWAHNAGSVVWPTAGFENVPQQFSNSFDSFSNRLYGTNEAYETSQTYSANQSYLVSRSYGENQPYNINQEGLSNSEVNTWASQGQCLARNYQPELATHDSTSSMAVSESYNQDTPLNFSQKLDPRPCPSVTYDMNDAQLLPHQVPQSAWPYLAYNNSALIGDLSYCQEHGLPQTTIASVAQDQRKAIQRPDRGIYPREHHTSGRQRRVSLARESPVEIAPKLWSGKVPSVRDKQRARIAVKAARDRTLQPGKLRRSGPMKSKKACWVCVLQKDPCEGGDHGYCDRCIARADRGQPNILGCVRTHLKEMQTTILPESMTQMHERGGLIQYVKAKATGWRGSRGIDALITTGFGPSFQWTLYEYEPAHPELLSRTQYFDRSYVEDGITKHISSAETVRSPPLGLKKLDESDGGYLCKLVDDMIDRHIQEFQRTCFHEKGSRFRKEVTSLLCILYMGLPRGHVADVVRSDLRNVLKMIAVTLIMDHTINLDPQHRDTVLSQLSMKQDLATYPEEISPWMVSMQIKYFFSEIRNQLYANNLERLNNILHSAKSVHPRLSTLIFVLGFALALEECQYTTLLQAQSRVIRLEEAPWPSWNKAKNHCDNIDSAFDFIRNLFHCRYTAAKNRQRADLNDWFKQSQSATEKHFLVSLITLSNNNREYLETRKDLPLDSATNKNHNARLLARFLLDVM